MEEELRSKWNSTLDFAKYVLKKWDWRPEFKASNANEGEIIRKEEDVELLG